MKKVNKIQFSNIVNKMTKIENRKDNAKKLKFKLPTISKYIKFNVFIKHTCAKITKKNIS